jgi:hypothetical protein
MLTGFVDLASETSGPGSNIDLILAKPASLEELRRAIFEVFTRDRTSQVADARSSAEPSRQSGHTASF